MVKSFLVVLCVSVVKAAATSAQPTQRVERPLLTDNELDSSLSSCNREDRIFLSTYSTKGRRKKMEDFYVSSDDCCFAGTVRILCCLPPWHATISKVSCNAHVCCIRVYDVTMTAIARNKKVCHRNHGSNRHTPIRDYSISEVCRAIPISSIIKSAMWPWHVFVFVEAFTAIKYEYSVYSTYYTERFYLVFEVEVAAALLFWLFSSRRNFAEIFQSDSWNCKICDSFSSCFIYLLKINTVFLLPI